MFSIKIKSKIHSYNVEEINNFYKKLDKVYIDNDIILINKPEGIACHGGSGISYGVIEWLRSQRHEHDYYELIHRLDKATSGCMLVAKNRQSLKNIQGMTISMLAILAKEDILTLNDFAELATFELIDKEEGIFKALNLDENTVNNMIMKAREKWFSEDK